MVRNFKNVIKFRKKFTKYYFLCFSRKSQYKPKMQKKTKKDITSLDIHLLRYMG